MAPIISRLSSLGGGGTGGFSFGKRKLPAAVAGIISADAGNGQGYSIAQGAGSTNGVYTSTSSTNYISSWYLSAGGNGTPLNYTCSGSSSNFAYHTGHNANSSQWPMYHAIQVSSATYGQIINKIEWYKHSNACGNVDMWGTTRSITGSNYTDTSLYTYLGRVNMGGNGSASDCTVSTGTFNPRSYGYNWILLQVQDISALLSYPSVGTLGGWAMYGMRLSMDPIISARYWRYVEGSAVASHHPRISRLVLTDDSGNDTNIAVYTSDNCADSGSYQPGTVSYDFGSNKVIVKARIYSTYNSALRSSNYTVQYSNDNVNWTTRFSGVMSNNSSCGLQDGTGGLSGGL